MFEFTPDHDKLAVHTALRMRNNTLPVSLWMDVLGLPEDAADLPSPITYGRLKFMLTHDRDDAKV